MDESQTADPIHDNKLYDFSTISNDFLPQWLLYYKCAKGASRNYESVIFGIFYLINSIRECLHGAFSSLGRKVRLIFTVQSNPK